MKWGRKRKESQILSHLEDDREPKASQSIMKTNPWFCQYHHLFPNYSRNESAITVKISSRLLDILVTQDLPTLLAVTQSEMNVSAKLSSPHYLTVSSLSVSVLDHSFYKMDPFWFWEEFTPRSVSITQYKDNSINSLWYCFL